jgi:two-component system, sensor histidine kinase
MSGKNLDELEQLRRSDARYHAVLLASAAIVWITSPEGEFVERQPGWEEYTGQSWDEYQYSKWISAIHPDDRPQVTADWTGAVGSGGPVHRTQGRVWSAKHQAWRAFQTRGVPVRDKAGEIVEWVGVLTDVQDAPDAQEKPLPRQREPAESRAAAAKLREQLRRLVEANSIGLITTRDNDIVEANDAFLRLIGRHRSQFALPTSWRELTPLGYEEADARALAQLREAGECLPFEKEYIRADGVRVPVLLGAVAFNREPLECVCFVVGITAQKQAEAALEQARRVAERVSEEKTRFLMAASHDLRQPMQALAALIGILAARPHDPDETALVKRADRAMRSLSDLLNALLDFSQLDAGVIRPNLDSFPAQRVLEAMREEFEIEASEKALQFTVQTCPCWIRSDPALLARMVRNLVSNAVKYTPSGGQVTVMCHQEQGRIRLEVRDTGRGIRPEMHEAIFEEFSQIGNRERDDRKGLGLGLSIVRKMAQLLDHQITLRSSPGAGSTFTISVPPAEPATEQPRSEFPFAGGQRVLLVDDNELVAEVLVSLLTDAGNDVVTANSAEQALAIVQSAETAFDAVISDYRLPTLSGLEVIECVRQRWPAATAIILSGDVFDARLHALSNTGVRVLRKPVGRETLAQALEGRFLRGAAGSVRP